MHLPVLVACALITAVLQPATNWARQAPAPPQPPRDLTQPFSRTLRATVPTDIAVTNKGWMYLVGSTRFADFVTTDNAFDRTCGTDSRCNPHPGRFGTEYFGDLTLTVFDPNGIVHYSTYLGGEGEEGAAHIALAADGSVWLAGTTSSARFDGQPGSPNCGGSGSIWIARFDVALRTMQNFRCVLGTGSVLDLALDAEGDPWITGTTSEAGAPLPTGWQPRPSRIVDGYVLEVSQTDLTIRSGTYIGGNSIDSPAAISIAPSGAIVTTGSTISTDFPVVRPFQSAWAGPFPWDDATVVSLDASGRFAHFSTLIGGTGQDRGTAVAVDAQGNIFVALQSASDDLPTSSDAYDRRCGTASACSRIMSDVYLAKFGPTGTLLASTFLGGNSVDYPRYLSMLADGSLLVAGSTQSPDFPLVPTLPAENRGFETGFIAFFDANLRTLRKSVLITDATHRPPTQHIAQVRDFTYAAGQITLDAQPATFLRKLFRLAPSTDH